MSSQSTKKITSVRMARLRAYVPLILFVFITALLELLVVEYAMSLGVKDTGLLQWSFTFPGATSPTTLALSPLFHLVPVCVIATLTFGWAYLSRRLSTRRQEIRKAKVEPGSRRGFEKKGILSKIRLAGRDFSKSVKARFSGANRFTQKLRLGRPTIRSAVFVLLVFIAFVTVFSLFAFPNLIYESVIDLYGTNTGIPSFIESTYNWARGAAGALGPIGWLASSINNGLLSAAPGFRNFVVGLDGVISPLASLDDSGKYLAFQNVATLISIVMILIYGERVGKGYRYKK